jgi:hypothetical protein
MSRINRTAIANARCVLAVFALGTSARSAAAETLELPMLAHKGYFSELCIDVGKGQRLAYELRTPYAVDFNLHHHPDGGGTVFPERLPLRSQHSNELTTESAGLYCFMATNLDNRPETFVLRVSYEVSSD